MKLTTKALLIIFLCLIHSAISTQITLNKHKFSRSKISDQSKANFKNFIQGLVAQFVGIDAQCLEKKEMETEEPKGKKTEDADIFNTIASGILETRTQIKSFFDTKLKEWIGKKTGFFSIFFSDATTTRKEKFYTDFVEKAERDINSVKTNLVNVIAAGKYDAEIIGLSLQVEVESVYSDMKIFVETFGKKGFTEYVKLDKFNDSMTEYNSVLPKDGVEKDPVTYNKTVWQKIKSAVATVYGWYQAFTVSTLGCLITSFMGLKSLITATLSTTALLVPGLNVVVVIWRVANLIKHFGIAIYNFYSAVKETDLKNKWISYGKALGGILRGIVYLATGAKKKQQKRRIKK
jgi:hypothetical protein